MAHVKKLAKRNFVDSSDKIGHTTRPKVEYFTSVLKNTVHGKLQENNTLSN